MIYRIVLLFLFFQGFGMQAQQGAAKPTDEEEAKKFLLQHHYSQVLKICNQNITDAESGKDHLTYALFLSIKGMAYLDTISADSGKIYFDRSLAVAQKYNHKNTINYSLYGIGKFYYRNSDQATAIKYFQLLHCYSLRDKNKDFQLIANYYLSANYNILGAYQLSMVYARKAAALSAEIKDTTSYIKSILAISNMFQILSRPDSSEFYCNKAYKIYDHYSRKNLGLGADIFNELAKIQLYKKNHDKAIYYSRLAIEDGLRNSNFTSLSIFYDNMAISFANKKMYDSAMYYYHKAIDIQLQYNFVDEYKQDLKEMFYISKITNNTKNIISYSEKFMAADSLYPTVSGSEIDSLRTAFELEKNAIAVKANEEKLIEVHKKEQVMYLLSGIIILLLLSIFSYLFYIRKTMAREKEKQTLLIRVKDSEIKALQSQMNPHFIFNSLNSVLEFISKSEMNDAINYLTKFSRLIRLVLEFSNKKNILLAEELELLKIYVELENIKSEAPFLYTFSMDENLDPMLYEIYPMLLQPFIENSIIHGIQNKIKLSAQNREPYKGELKLSLAIRGGLLECTIEDNGVGRDKALEIKKRKVFNHMPLGMRITEDRLDLINEKGCEVKYMDMINENGDAIGTRLEIFIPLIESF